ncbi:CYTH domain-containing protein [Dickeya chrysanthemi]|uniref:CYTH domain-containing protein n=1 Tax=Dickeya chrysanthemi TaxID=556 RepID=UPI0003A53F9E|nr:inorganic triphosphatase [Dickeya chrysanthemi]MBX9446204.1 inorganic triphosphatase [Dickeya chrysanthemi]
MSEEIELKFIIHPDATAALRQGLKNWQSDVGHSNHLHTRQLVNSYYETADGYLRQHDIGLRIRGENGRYEMTVKTAGKVVGGLHQHPEYNVDLPGPQLDIRLMPSEIWPEDCDVAALAQALSPLFSTDFQRESWVVSYHQSLIEIAVDQGKIHAGELVEPLCELELELKNGRTEDLLAFASELADIGGLRQGGLSKAARGYHLAKGNPERVCRELGFLPVQPKITLEQGIAAGLEHAFSHWQYHEELWARGNAAARPALLEAGAMMRELLVLAGGVLPRKVTAEFRAALTHLEEAIERTETADTLCYSVDYLKGKLILTSWLVKRGWRGYMDNRELMRLQSSWKRFADIMMSRGLAELKAVFSHALDALHYTQQLPRLQRGVYTFLLLGGSYPQEEAARYLQQWRELMQLIEALSIGQVVPNALETCRKQALARSPFWLHSGQ